MITKPALRILGPVALFVVVAGLYAPSLGHEFIYDDHPIMSEPAPTSLGDLAAVFTRQTTFNLPYYRPMSRITIVAQRYVHGDHPASYHAFNAALMGAAALLAVAVLRLPAFGVPWGLALLGGALFGLHPIASSVVYPFSSGRETLVPALWVIAALYGFLRGGRRWYGFALLAFGLALLSKEQAIVTPALFVLADLLGLSPGSPGRDPRRWLARYLPVLGILLVYVCMRWLLFGGGGQHQLVVHQQPSVPVWSLLYALQSVFAPFAEFHYQPRRAVWLAPARLLASIGLVLLLGRAAQRSWPVQRGPLLFWLGWFAIALLPTANLLAQEVRFAERWVFVSLLGAIGIGSAVATAHWGSPAARRGSLAIGIALVLACAALSAQRAQYFRDDRSFAAQWLHSDPDSAHAHFVSAETRAAAGELEDAVRHYRRALEISPDRPEIHVNLARALRAQGRHKEAMQHYYRALELDPSYSGHRRR